MRSSSTPPPSGLPFHVSLRHLASTDRQTVVLLLLLCTAYRLDQGLKRVFLLQTVCCCFSQKMYGNRSVISPHHPFLPPTSTLCHQLTAVKCISPLRVFCRQKPRACRRRRRSLCSTAAGRRASSVTSFRRKHFRWSLRLIYDLIALIALPRVGAAVTPLPYQRRHLPCEKPPGNSTKLSLFSPLSSAFLGSFELHFIITIYRTQL